MGRRTKPRAIMARFYANANTLQTRMMARRRSKEEVV